VGILNLLAIALIIVLTYVIKMKTGMFYIKSFLFRFLDSSNLWYFLVFATIKKPRMVITLIEGFNQSYWKVLRIIPILEWIEFE